MVQKNRLNGKTVIICGATASGKTELAVALALKTGGEVISADSMTVYKELNVGTAKPDKTELRGVEYHLLDAASPFDNFSVGDYKELAEPILERILGEGKTPIVCGGTGFYVNSLVFDYSYGKAPANLEARKKYMDLADENGNAYVYDILKKVDPLSANKIHENDLKRVVRALEIYESGIPKSSICDEKKPKRDYAAFSIDFPREILYERINRRVDAMIKNGLVTEVQSLIDIGVTDKNQCMQGIGYKEIYSYLTGNISLEEAVEQIKLNTRRYAKRQITFFKNQLPGVINLPPVSSEENAEFIIDKLKGNR